MQLSDKRIQEFKDIAEKEMLKKYPSMIGVHKENLPIK